ncbi:class I SAM-dependent methyltransferase [Roseibium sp. M-1]
MITDIEASRDYWETRAPHFDIDFEKLEIRKRTARRLFEIVQPNIGEIILDAGVGTAKLFREYSKSFTVAERLLGLDFSEAMLDIASVECRRAGLENFEPIHGLYTKIPLPDNSVDCVVSSLALHHVTDDDKRRAVSEFGRVLKEGGRLVVADQLNCTGREMTPAEFQLLMVRTFFPDEDETLVLNRTRQHKEYTCSIDDFASLVSSEGFRTEQEVLSDFVGIVYSV